MGPRTSCRLSWLLVLLLVADAAAAEEGFFAKFRNLDRQSPEQGWQSMQAAYDIGSMPKGMERASVFAEATGWAPRSSTYPLQYRQPGASTLAVVEPPLPDSQRHGLVRRYEEELAREKTIRKGLIATTVVLGGACVGSLVLGNPVAATITCMGTVGLYSTFSLNRKQIEFFEDQLIQLKR